MALDFQSDAARVGALCYFLSCLFSLAFFIGRRTTGLRVTSLSSWMSWSLARLCTLANWVTSALFFVASLLILFGVGANASDQACASVNLICILVYSTSKISVILFLIEKVRIVQPVRKPRLRSKLYLACLALMLPAVAILALMLVGRKSVLDGKEVCRIGLERYASITVVTYDLVLVTFLTVVFVRSLLSSRAQLVSPMVRSVAIRSLVAAVLSMSVNGANAIILFVHPLELSWVCMISCGTDVVVNSWILFFATSQSERHHSSRDNEKREEAAIVRFTKSMTPGQHSFSGQALSASADGNVPTGTGRPLAHVRPLPSGSRMSFEDDDLASGSDEDDVGGDDDDRPRDRALSIDKSRIDSRASTGSADLVALGTLAYEGSRQSSVHSSIGDSVESAPPPSPPICEPTLRP